MSMILETELLKNLLKNVKATQEGLRNRKQRVKEKERVKKQKILSFANKGVNF